MNCANNANEPPILLRLATPGISGAHSRHSRNWRLSHFLSHLKALKFPVTTKPDQ